MKITSLILYSFYLFNITNTTKTLNNNTSADPATFLSNLQSEMRSFAVSNTPLKKKPKQANQEFLSPNMIIHLPETTLDMVKDVTQDELSQIVLKYSSLTRRQQNCLTIRKYLEILPSTTSYYSSFWNWSWNPFATKDPHDEMKSYRTMAYKILNDVEYLDPEVKEMVNEKVIQLQTMKLMYFNKYFRKNEKELEEKKEKHKTTQKEITKLESNIRDLKIKMKTTEYSIRRGYQSLVRFVQNDAKLKQSIRKVMSDIDWFSNKKNQVELASTGEEVSEILKHVNSNKSLERLKKQLIIANDYRQLIESVEYLIEHSRFNSSAEAIAKSNLGTLKLNLKTLEKQIKETKSSLINPIDKKLKSLENIVYYDKNYNQYKKTIKNVIELKKTLNSQKTEMNNMKLEIEKKTLDLETFNVQEYSDFVLPSTVLFNLKGKLEQLKKIRTFTGTRAPDPTFDDRTRVDFKTEYNDYLDRLDNIQYILQFSLQEDVDEVMKKVVSQMVVVGDIENTERELDELLGSIFAEIFEMEGNTRCFTIPQLSYLFFNMFKSNTIANQHRFLIIFLNQLNFTHVKEFVLHNYSLFTSKEFIANFEETYATNHSIPEKVFKLQNDYIDQFVVNYISVIDIYKDLTDFRDPTTALDQGEVFMKVWRSLGVNLGRALLEDIAEYTLESLVKLLLNKIIGLIPFINSIPFLEDITGYLVWTIAGFITKKLMKLFGKYMKVIYSSMSDFISSFRNKNYDFDYEKVIHEEFNPDPMSTHLNFSFDDLDKIYYNAYNTEGDLYDVVIENSRFYEQMGSTVSKSRLAGNKRLFDEYVIGDLVMTRLFNSRIPVHVEYKGVNYNLSKVDDYELKAELFNFIFFAISMDKDLKNYFFNIYQRNDPNKESTNAGIFDECSEVSEVDNEIGLIAEYSETGQIDEDIGLSTI
jgi:hypothetical protein